MPLRLIYKAQTSIPVEVEGLVPTLTREMSLADVERLEVCHGNEKRTVADFFLVRGDASDSRIEFEGNLAGVHRIGARMCGGAIHVEGDVGRHLGSEMTGGEIHVSGSAGDWVGAEMHGGLIHVRGRSGNLIGSAYRGAKHGMTGGTLLVGGDVGNEIGHSMRRGLLVVGGQCGDFPGINMIAGTILVFGSSGIRPAAGMRRGTLGLLSRTSVNLLPTFRRGGSDRPLFLQLIFRELARLGFDFDDSLAGRAFRTYHGDFLAGGRGEVLVHESDN